MIETDIWTTANLLIEQHGDQAEVVAAQYVEDMRAQGATIGAVACDRIIAAIATLRLAWPEPNPKT
jgi:hypothetical protein